MQKEQFKIGSLRQRANGLYEFRFYKNGRQLSVYSRKKTIIRQKFKQALTVNQQKVKMQIILYKDFLQTWLNTYKKPYLQVTSYKNIECIINKYLVNTLGLKAINKITAAQIQIVINSIDKSRTRQILANIINNSLEIAHKINLIYTNPFNLVEKPKHTTKNRIALTRDQQQKLIVYLQSHPLKNLYLFYLYTGVRRAEALKIEWLDINRDKGYILIKGTKSKTSYREIPLTSQIGAILEEIKPYTKRVFAYNNDYVSQEFTKICYKLDFKNICLHSLRHTYASNLYELGIPLKITQKWLGHSKAETTSNIYTHISNDYEQMYIDKLNKSYP
ncbi:MAG: tyrosine-type recombinase/integrase [Clostridia bacterium]|nr:tyrosine-type recombinase/integrase [Clostridia bacterium]